MVALALQAPFADNDPTAPRRAPTGIGAPTSNRSASRLATSLEHWDDREVIVVRDRSPSSSPRRSDPLGTADACVLAEAARRALAARLPLVIVVTSAVPDPASGMDGLCALGSAAQALTRCSGSVPVLLGIAGPLVGPPALLAGLADQVVVGPDTVSYLSGPRAVAAMTAEQVDATRLGGPGVHGCITGVASLVAEDDEHIEELLALLVAYLPASVDELAPRQATTDPTDRCTAEAAVLLPSTPTGSYDVRDVLRVLVDDGDFVELRSGWAPNLVTGLATIGGDPVAVLANQPCALAGTIDIAASQKGARFVAFADAFNLPLLSVVDTPGFSPGKTVEWRGMIRHGAQLAFAYARATVPRVSLTLRKSYGGAYIVMDAKTMGNDVALAWPTAQIAVMGARGATQILHRNADPAELATLEADYEVRHLTPWRAAERGLIDAVIDPSESRREIAAALAMLRTKRESLPARAHDNGPL